MSIPSLHSRLSAVTLRGRVLFAALVLCAASVLVLQAGLAPAQDRTVQDAAAKGQAGEAIADQTGEDEPKTFADWMRKAREGDPKAQCNVGIYYVNGKQVPLNVHMGVEWLTRSANQGFSYAQYVLAEIYTSGESDLEADTRKAYYWASLSAASTDLPEKIQLKAEKLRGLNQDRLPQDVMRAVQQETAAWWEKHAPKSQ